MRLRSLFIAALIARSTAAQTPVVGSVRGVVFDSIAFAPLAGAMVQLVGADAGSAYASSLSADSLGRFEVKDVPKGRYNITFFHPMLDSLGIEPPLREIRVDDQRPVRADLAIPSIARLRATVCGENAPADSTSLLIGSVRDAHGAPVAGAKVEGEWLELTVSRTGFVRHVVKRVSTAGGNGWFAMCNVPAGGAMTLFTANGADSTDRIELEIPTEGFKRQELYVGARSTTGTRFTGTVVAEAEGRPLTGALVGIVNGPQTHTNERGEFTLVDAPPGTRTLEVHAVAFYPDRRTINVIPQAPPVHVALKTLKAVLDTVRVIAARNSDRHRSGFEERKRSGVGTYRSAADIAKRSPFDLSALFRTMSGVKLERNGIHSPTLQVRGVFDQWCSPTIFLDGARMISMSVDDLNTMLQPKDVMGIEVYHGGTAPAQFQDPFSGCGSVVIWTK